MKRVRLGVWIYPFGAGGVEHFLARLLAELRGRGFEIVCFAASGGAGTRFYRKRGFEVLVMNGKDSAVRLARALRARQVDAVMTTLYEPTAARACRLAGIPHVWRCGGLVEVAAPTLPPGVRRRVTSLIDLLSDAVVANSRIVAAQFDRVCPEKVVRIPNGLTAGRGRPGPAPDLRRRFSWPASAPLVAMSAHFYPYKRHEDFVRAAAGVAARRPDCRFVVFGGVFSGNAGRQMKRCEARVLRLRAARGLKNKMAMVRGMDDLGGVLGQADVFVHPSPDESFPNSVLEAMAAGKPVIAAGAGGCAELISTGKTGILVPPRRPDLLASAVETLLADPRKARRLGAAARRSVRRFGIRTAALRYERVVRGVLRARDSKSMTSRRISSSVRRGR
ncbi:MAG TPA: glycosyltransferase family 4 protein [Candidatus Eisenbacteria bacterium]|nr:glycosyltransferase family 4 protein [Candidatus Eisenbacteria bacterium]